MDISEFNLHRIHRELHEAYPTLPLSIMLADVCDAAAVAHVFERHRPDIVFHAAAYKQVPMLEAHPREAVRVNTLGTQTVARAAAEHGAGRFVLVSSDKAVHPANVMGGEQATRRDGVPRLRRRITDSIRHGAIRKRARLRR